MSATTILINGQNKGAPRNWQDIEITVDWLKTKESGAVNVSDLAFTGPAKDYLQNRLLDGISGGLGPFEGVPLDILVGNPQNPAFRFEGYLDLTDETTVIGKEEIICSLKKVQGDDWLNDTADAFGIGYLRSIGLVTDADAVRVPYVINYVPDGMQLIVLAMSIYMITKELIEHIQSVSDAIADATNSTTPVVGTSVGAGAGVVTAWDLGDIIAVALKIVSDLIYNIAMTIAIKKLIEELFEQLMPKKRYHVGMSFYKMMERCCQNLGLQFQSNLLSQRRNWVYIPEKDRKGGENGEMFWPSSTGPYSTFGNIIRELKKEFNADYRISNGVFRFERRDQFKTPSPFQMPKYFNDQERRLQAYRLNTSEIVANYNIYYEYDTQDQNTLDDQTGRVFQAITTPKIVGNEKLVNIKHLAKINIPHSLPKEKTGLTDVEKVFKALAKVVDSITGIFGGGTNYASKIEDRIGSLLLSSHFLSIGKVVVMQGSKLAANQRQLLDVRLLWETLHYINSFALYKGEHNQFFRFLDIPVPLTLEQFSLILDNNQFIDSDGNDCEIEKIVFNPEKTTAVIDIRVKKEYTKNLKITFV